MKRRTADVVKAPVQGDVHEIRNLRKIAKKLRFIARMRIVLFIWPRKKLRCVLIEAADALSRLEKQRAWRDRAHARLEKPSGALKVTICRFSPDTVTMLRMAANDQLAAPSIRLIQRLCLDAAQQLESRAWFLESTAQFFCRISRRLKVDVAAVRPLRSDRPVGPT